MIHGSRTLSRAGVNFAIAASFAVLGPNVDVAQKRLARQTYHIGHVFADRESFGTQQPRSDGQRGIER